MSTIANTFRFDDFGARLREERLRLGYSQKEFAKVGGVGRSSQILYEQSERPPTIEYLARVTDAGVDFQYVLTGERSAYSGELICIEPSLLDRALTVADRLSRDDQGKLYDLEVRNTIAKAVLLAVAGQKEKQIHWDELEQRLRTNLQ